MCSSRQSFVKIIVSIIDPARSSILERKNFSRMKIPGLGLNRLSIPVETTFFLFQ